MKTRAISVHPNETNYDGYGDDDIWGISECAECTVTFCSNDCCHETNVSCSDCGDPFCDDCANKGITICRNCRGTD